MNSLEIYLEKKLNIVIPQNNNLKYSFFQTPVDLYNDMARLMAEKIKENNEKGFFTLFILPVGPRGQYARFAHICNTEKITCKKLITVNMDEYLDENQKLVSEENPVSFRKYMKENLFNVLDYDLRVEAKNIFFPDPDNISVIEKLFQETGRPDICFGGVGINGHIAFNEPIGKGCITAEEFAELPSRIVQLTKETIMMNSLKYGGDFNVIPKNCITIGMKEIFLSKELRFYLEHNWQLEVLKKIICESPTTSFPASFLKLHNNCTVSFSDNVLTDIYVSKTYEGETLKKQFLN